MSNLHMQTCRRALLVAVLLVIAAPGADAQSAPLNPLAGKWTGVDQNNHPVTLELVIKGEEATGTLSIGPDPVKTLANGKVQGTTVTFTTPAMVNGREITIAWRGELKDDRLTFRRQLGGGPEMSPLSLQPAASADAKSFLGVWVIEMNEPPEFKGTHRIRIWDNSGTIAASLQTNPNFPAIEATGIHRDGNMLVLTLNHQAKPHPMLENGMPIWAVVSAVVDGATMKVAQMLERSQTIKRGTGNRQN